MQLNLAEKLILACINTEKGKLERAHYLSRYGLAAAVALELHRLGKVRIGNKFIEAIDQTSTGNEVLDEALRKLVSKGKPMRLHGFIGGSIFARNLRNGALKVLEDSGIIRSDKVRFLWLFPMKRYPVINKDIKDKLIESLKLALLSGDYREVNRDDACLISILAVCRAIRLIVSSEEKKLVKDKLKPIVKGEYFRVEEDALQEILKAIRYAIAAEAAAASAASGGS